MTATTMPMLRTYPAELSVDRHLLAEVIDALIDCSEACTSCADSCLSEPHVSDMIKCIRTNMDCADVCATTARVLSRHTGYDANLTKILLEASAAACRSCADECEGHGMLHGHCRICADACMVCKSACRKMLAVVV